MIERETLPEWIKFPSSMHAGYFYWQNKATGACVWEDPNPKVRPTGPPPGFAASTSAPAASTSVGMQLQLPQQPQSSASLSGLQQQLLSSGAQIHMHEHRYAAGCIIYQGAQQQQHQPARSSDPLMLQMSTPSPPIAPIGGQMVPSIATQQQQPLMQQPIQQQQQHQRALLQQQQQQQQQQHSMMQQQQQQQPPAGGFFG